MNRLILLGTVFALLFLLLFGQSVWAQPIPLDEFGPGKLQLDWSLNGETDYQWLIRDPNQPTSIIYSYMRNGNKEEGRIVLNLPEPSTTFIQEAFKLSVPDDATDLSFDLHNGPFRAYLFHGLAVMEEMLRERGAEIGIGLQVRMEGHLSLDLQGALEPLILPSVGFSFYLEDGEVKGVQQLSEGQSDVNIYALLFRSPQLKANYDAGYFTTAGEARVSVDSPAFALESRYQSGNYEDTEHYYADVTPKKTVRLVFESEDLRPDDPKAYTLVADAATRIPVVPKPVRQGQSFDGWQDQAGKRYTDFGALSLAEDTTLYPRWRQATVPQVTVPQVTVPPISFEPVPSPTLWTVPVPGHPAPIPVIQAELPKTAAASQLPALFWVGAAMLLKYLLG